MGTATTSGIARMSKLCGYTLHNLHLLGDFGACSNHKKKKKLDTSEAVLATNTILSVLPIRLLHVHMKIAFLYYTY